MKNEIEIDEWGIDENWGADSSEWLLEKPNSVLEKFKTPKMNVSDLNKEKDYEKAIDLETRKMLDNKHSQQKQMHDMRDHKYYACIVFVNENDKKEFFKLLNKSIEIVGETFIDGYDLAEKHFSKIEMSAKLPVPKNERTKK